MSIRLLYEKKSTAGQVGLPSKFQVSCKR